MAVQFLHNPSALEPLRPPDTKKAAPPPNKGTKRLRKSIAIYISYVTLTVVVTSISPGCTDVEAPPASIADSALTPIG